MHSASCIIISCIPRAKSFVRISCTKWWCIFISFFIFKLVLLYYHRYIQIFTVKLVMWFKRLLLANACIVRIGIHYCSKHCEKKTNNDVIPWLPIWEHLSHTRKVFMTINMDMLFNSWAERISIMKMMDTQRGINLGIMLMSLYKYPMVCRESKKWNTYCKRCKLTSIKVHVHVCCAVLIYNRPLPPEKETRWGGGGGSGTSVIQWKL